MDHLYFGGGGATGVQTAKCKACDYKQVWIESAYFGVTEPTMVFSGGLAGPPLPEDLPEELLPIYDEARAVADASPRSAAALLRLTLEGLLSGLHSSAGNLNAMIGAARTDGLPGHVVKAMDVMRFNGNESVHELHLEDSAEIVATLFSLLQIVVERLLTEPARISALYENMPETVRAQIERRDSPPATD